MKKLYLYYVFDNIGECSITQPIPLVNDLCAAISFRDTFIKGSKSKEYNYKALDLVKFGAINVTVDGNMEIDTDYEIHEVWNGNEIIDFISKKSVELGIDDNFVEEEKNESV